MPCGVPGPPTVHAAGRVEQACCCGLFLAHQRPAPSQQAGHHCMPDTNYLCCQMFCLPCDIETHCQGLVLSVLCCVG